MRRVLDRSLRYRSSVTSIAPSRRMLLSRTDTTARVRTSATRATREESSNGLLLSQYRQSPLAQALSSGFLTSSGAQPSSPFVSQRQASTSATSVAEQSGPGETKKDPTKPVEGDGDNTLTRVEAEPGDVFDPASAPHTLIIDAGVLIHSSYHTHRGLTTRGQPSGAIYGFTRSLIKLCETLHFDIGIVAMDSGGRTFRHDIQPSYKSQRPPADDNLVVQFDGCRIAAEAMGLEVVRVAGYEADDLIATYARQAKELGHFVTIVSPDKDLAQLVDRQVVLYNSQRQNYTDEIGVLEKFGVKPSQVADYLALAGDKADNIPGVKGVGPKTAARLLTHFGSLDKMLVSLDEIAQDRLREALDEASSYLRANRLMTRLMDDVPGVTNISFFTNHVISRDKFSEFIDTYEFHSINPDRLRLPFDGATEREPAVQQLSITGEVVTDETPLCEIGCPNTTIVSDVETAERVVAQLMKIKDTVHACDTEVVDLKLNVESPVGHGRVICASIYCGPDHDFGGGPRVWIDNLDEAEGVLEVFKPYFEDETIPKVWHNYSFDRHVLGNHNINVVGFGGDTMHMARLWDSSRTQRGGYSLANLSSELLKTGKRNLKERFARPMMLKDGTEGKTLVLPELDELQRIPSERSDWIDYSVFDAECTWGLYYALVEKLKEMPWMASKGTTMLDYYTQIWRPFGEILTDMERYGVFIDTEHLRVQQKVAEAESLEQDQIFKTWAGRRCADAAMMNAGSAAQLRHFLFAPYKHGKSGEMSERTDTFSVPNVHEWIEEGKTRPLKNWDIQITGLGIPVVEYTPAGVPSVGVEVLAKLAGNPDKRQWGLAYRAFGGGARGEEACFAIASLLKRSSIDKLLNGFIVPLQRLPDENGRIHASFNINTETGRLSSRNPNLQNQPAHDKDRYRIRHAFVAERGNSLIVADYGQIELRLLAHVSKCKSMLDAFEKGGDFHSRTALGMYPEIQRAVKEGKCLLEWDGADGESPPVPLLKDMFASERKKAKVLNFSIAYGKTVHGLSRDWGVSLEEARNTLELWYADRPEVREWQQRTIAAAHENGFVRTLTGRYRPLPDIGTRTFRRHMERVAINTPLQGGAADIVVLSMVKLHSDPVMQRLGWKLCIQVHDELVLEGPSESSEEALARVIEVMSHPLDRELLVTLPVDASIGQSWFEGK